MSWIIITTVNLLVYLITELVEEDIVLNFTLSICKCSVKYRIKCLYTFCLYHISLLLLLVYLFEQEIFLFIIFLLTSPLPVSGKGRGTQEELCSAADDR